MYVEDQRDMQVLQHLLQLGSTNVSECIDAV